MRLPRPSPPPAPPTAGRKAVCICQWEGNRDPRRKQRGRERWRLHAKGRMTGALKRKPPAPDLAACLSAEPRRPRAPGNRRGQAFCPLEQLRPLKDEAPPEAEMDPHRHCIPELGIHFSPAEWFLDACPVPPILLKDWFAQQIPDCPSCWHLQGVDCFMFSSQPHLPPLGLSGRVFVTPQFSRGRENGKTVNSRSNPVFKDIIVNQANVSLNSSEC